VVPLLDCAGGGEPVDFWVEAGCNDLFGAYREGGRLREASIVIVRPTMKSLFHDFSVLLDLAATLGPRSARRARILAALSRAASKLAKFDEEEAAKARVDLQPELAKTGGTPSLYVSATGQAHLDLAWLWPIRETIRKGGRTFATVLALMERYPDYVFGASQAQFYQWIKDNYPDLYARVKEKIGEGRWEAQGAMWVEADVNLSGGESIVRQLIYGKRFFREEFGVEAKVAWLPDNFGFPASLPQILKKSGIEYFMTIKLSWNTTNQFPRHSFWWRGVDTSRVLAHMAPEGTYNSAALPHSIRAIEEGYLDKDVSEHALLLYGIGDGGGGPGEEHLERLQRVRNLEGLPPIRQETSLDFFNRLAGEAGHPRGVGFRTWTGELYLERHQGTYTTQARSKRFNRKLELGLRELEWISVLAARLAGLPYPSEVLNRIWKEVLLYQFHDILPGTSIGRVYDESTTRYAALLSEVEQMTAAAAASLAGAVEATGFNRPILVLNPLPWTRSEWIRVEDQWLLARDIPAFGYALVEASGSSPAAEAMVAEERLLENEYLKIEFGQDGSISSCLDKEHNRQIIDGDEGNRLIAYHDPGDAWDFDPGYRKGTWQRCRLDSAHALIDGPCAILRQRYRVGESTIDQDVVLTSGSRRVDFNTRVDWQETHTMLRTSFPVRVHSSEATCDVQFATIKRPTHENTSWDVARDEVCAHKWVDLSQRDYGVALLNDCKYGHRLRDNVIDLNLLRSTTWPDPAADRGTHEFTYSLFPHAGDHVEGNVMQAGYELNVPLRVVDICRPEHGALPATFMGFCVDAGNVMIETVKSAEESASDVIVRAYEWAGWTTATTLRSDFDILSTERTNLMEEPEGAIPVAGRQIRMSFEPFEIVTLKLTLAQAHG
jgi:alpha-mannosidase